MSPKGDLSTKRFRREYARALSTCYGRGTDASYSKIELNSLFAYGLSPRVLTSFVLATPLKMFVTRFFVFFLFVKMPLKETNSVKREFRVNRFAIDRLDFSVP